MGLWAGQGNSETTGAITRDSGIRGTGKLMRRPSMWTRVTRAICLVLPALPAGLFFSPNVAAGAEPVPLAAEFAVHPDLVAAQRDFEKARGAEAYVALG